MYPTLQEERLINKIARLKGFDLWAFSVNVLALAILPFYICSMFVAPWLLGDFRWTYVHSVWNNWQSLNVGMLAFLSSTIALNISRYNAEKKRQREFVAARAFLPDALSQLAGYLRNCAEIVSEAWPRVSNQADRCRTPLAATMPNLPEGYRETFSRCIERADSGVGEHLANILTKLQVHHSRFRELHASFNEDARLVHIPASFVSYIYRLGELQALVNNTFDFARGETDSIPGKPDWDDYISAYRNLDIWVEQIDDLVGFTKRATDREGNPGA